MSTLFPFSVCIDHVRMNKDLRFSSAFLQLLHSICWFVVIVNGMFIVFVQFLYFIYLFVAAVVNFTFVV